MLGSTWLLLLCLPGTVLTASLLTQLSDLKGDLNTFEVEAGSLLFISSNDDDEVLQNINVFTDDNNKISAKDLAKQYILETIRKIGMKLNSTKLIIQNTNTADVKATLHGSLYVTTKNQAEDQNFFVIDNIRPANLHSNAGKKTIVVFNMYVKSSNANRPDYHGNVQLVANDGTVSMDMYMGVPGQGGDVFFQNPIEFFTTSKKVKQFFPKTEVLPVNANVFYIKSDGSNTITVTQTWADTNRFFTKQSTTTGLLSTSGGPFLDQIVSFSADLKLNGITYIQHVGSPTSPFQGFLSKPGGEVSFNIEKSVFESGSYMHPNLFSTLSLKSTTSDIGTFFLQYVVIEGEANGGTTPVTKKPVTPAPSAESTTKATTGLSYLFAIFTVIVSRIL